MVCYSRTLFLAIIANCHQPSIWPCFTSHSCCAILHPIRNYIISSHSFVNVSPLWWVVCGVRMLLLIPQYWQYALDMDLSTKILCKLVISQGWKQLSGQSLLPKDQRWLRERVDQQSQEPGGWHIFLESCMIVQPEPVRSDL